MQIDNADIRPSLLSFGYFNGYESSRCVNLTPRTCYDYEIEYYLRSEGAIVYDGQKQKMAPGDISIRKPGQQVLGILPYECYVICVDLQGKRFLPEHYRFGSILEAQPRYENASLNVLPDRLHMTNSDRVLRLFRELEKCLQEPVTPNRLKVNAITQLIFAEVLQEAEFQSKMLPRCSAHVRKAIDYIEEHYAEDLDISALIRTLGVSKAYFNRNFKEYCGMTPGQMILSRRMEKAKMLLSISDLSVAEVASLCGFTDASYFSRRFNQDQHCKPRDYRKQTRSH